MPLMISPPCSDDEDCFESADEGDGYNFDLPEPVIQTQVAPHIAASTSSPVSRDCVRALRTKISPHKVAKNVINEDISVENSNTSSSKSKGMYDSSVDSSMFLDVAIVHAEKVNDSLSSECISRSYRTNDTAILDKVSTARTIKDLSDDYSCAGESDKDVDNAAMTEVDGEIVDSKLENDFSSGSLSIQNDVTDSAVSGSNLIAGEGLLDWEARWSKSKLMNFPKNNPYLDSLNQGSLIEGSGEDVPDSCIVDGRGWVEADMDCQIDGDTWDPDADWGDDDDIDHIGGANRIDNFESNSNDATNKVPEATLRPYISSCSEKVIDEKSTSGLCSNQFDSNVTKSSAPSINSMKDEASAREALARLTGDYSNGESKVPWSGWGGSLLSAAATFTNSVSDGFTTVMEGALGAPRPEELAAAEKSPATISSVGTQDISPPAALGNDNHQSQSGLLDTFSAAIGNTSKSIVTGSIDVLETLGKKTFEVITDRDAETSRRTLKFKKQQHTLSQLLQEVKDRGDPSLSQALLKEPGVSYASFFEEYNGDVHLEALTLLSRNCAKIGREKLSLLADDQRETCEKFMENFHSCVIPEEETDASFSENSAMDIKFSDSMRDILAGLDWGFVPTKLCKIRNTYDAWIKDCCQRQQGGEQVSGEEIHKQGLRCLCQITASCLELLHKTGQLALADGKDPTASCEVLSKLQHLLCNQISALTVQFSTAMNTAADDSEEPDEVISLLTNLFLEASNSRNYVQEAFQLLAPVLRLLMAQNLQTEVGDAAGISPKFKNARHNFEKPHVH